MALVVHICAAPGDDATARELTKHLEVTRLTVTYTGCMPSGEDERAWRTAQIDASDAVLLLVSVDLFASALCMADVEHALDAGKRGKLVIPVLCRPCSWKRQPLARLRCLPSGEEAISLWGERKDAAYEGIAGEVDRLLRAPEADLDLPCPFPGLDVFDEEVSDYFFGREADVRDALRFLGGSTPHRRWLHIDGPSGVGKSSFARAGLVPALRRGELRDGPSNWHVVVLQPGTDPLVSLARALCRGLPGLAGHKDSAELERKLSMDDSALASFAADHAGNGVGVLLIVDQLEEVFTLGGRDRARAARFDALLNRALDDLECPIYLVTTIRSDFSAHMGDLPALERRLNEAGRYYLRPMGAEALRDVIEKPALRAGLEWTDGLPARIVDDAMGSQGALPLVAHVLLALWQVREGRVLTDGAYSKLGGVGGALTNSADKILEELGEIGKSRAQRLLLGLVRVGRGSSDTRKAVGRDEAVFFAGADDEAKRVLARLSGGQDPGKPRVVRKGVARLVAVSGEPQKERVELVHDALIQRWDTLRSWIESERPKLELRDDIEDRARRWHSQERPDDDLARGSTLAAFRGVDAASLSEQGRAYVQRADLVEKRRVRWRRLGLSALVVGLAGTVAILATLNRRANEATRRAEHSTIEVQVNRLAAGAALAGREGKPQLELLLAVEAVRLARSSEVTAEDAEAALINAVNREPPSTPLPDAQEVGRLEWSDDGRYVIGSLDRTWGRTPSSVKISAKAVLWDVASINAPKVITAPEREHPEVIFDAMLLAPDGKTALALTRPHDRRDKVAGELVSWQLAHPEMLTSLGEFRMNLAECAFGADGNRFIAKMSERKPSFRASACILTADGSAPPVCLLLQGVGAAAMDRSGQRIAAAGADGSVNVHRTDGEGAPLTILKGTTMAGKIAFSPDGEQVIVVSNDRKARIVRADGTGDTILIEEPAGVTSAAFDVDGTHVAVGQVDGAIGFWQLPTAEPASWLHRVASLHGHEGAVNFVALDPEGRFLLSRDSREARIWDLHGLATAVPRTPNPPAECFVFRGGELLRGTPSADAPEVQFSVGGEVQGVLDTGALVNDCDFSRDGTRMIATLNDGSVGVGRSPTGTEIAKFQVPKGYLKDAVLSPDGAFAIALDGLNVLKLRMNGSSRAIAKCERPTSYGSPPTVALSADGHYLALACGDGALRVLETSRGKTLLTLSDNEAQTGDFHAIAFGEHGSLLAAATADGRVRIWNVSGREIATLDDERAPISALGFSPDTRRLAVASYDGTVRLWRVDAPDRRPVVLRVVRAEDGAVQMGHAIRPNHVSRFLFSPDGQELVMSLPDGQIRSWTLNSEVLIAEACARAGRNLTGGEWRRYFGSALYRKTCEAWPEGSESHRAGARGPVDGGSFVLHNRGVSSPAPPRPGSRPSPVRKGPSANPTVRVPPPGTGRSAQ